MCMTSELPMCSMRSLTLLTSCWSLGSESIGAEAVVDVRKIWLLYQDKRDT